MLRVKPLTDSPYATLSTKADDTGYDLYVTQRMVLLPGIPAKVKHGIAIELPEGYAATIRPRSSTLFRRTDVAASLEQVEAVTKDFGGDVLIRPMETAPEPYDADRDNWREVSVPTPLHVQYGTVDASYRGELMTAVVNVGRVGVVLEAGERISQLTIEAVAKPEIVVVNTLSETERATAGFGSSGK